MRHQAELSASASRATLCSFCFNQKATHYLCRCLWKWLFPFCFLSPTKPSSSQLQLLQSPNICLPCLPRNSPMIWTSVFRTFRGICLALSHMKTPEMRLNNTFHYWLKVDVHHFRYWTQISHRMVLRGKAFEKWVGPEGGALANGVINIRGDPGQVIHVQTRFATHAGSCGLRKEVGDDSGKASSTQNSTLRIGLWKWRLGQS